VVAPTEDNEDDYIVKQPVMMAEITSKQSSHRDQVKKRREYFEVESMKYYLIVSQDEMWVILHTRGESGNWETQYLTEPEDVVHLKEFDLQINLAAIYRRVKLS
jgi:Uma2 family endonuclease